MEKFILRGYSNDEYNSKKTPFYLRIPQAKTFDQVQIAVKPNCEEETFPEKLILEAVNRRKSPIIPYENAHIHPRAIIDGKIQPLQATLQQMLSEHPFPLSQGPIVLPLDTRTEEKKTVDDVLKNKTVFAHSETQACSLWSPDVLGTAAWTDTRDKGTYVVTQPDKEIKGVASTMDMSMVYTCQLLKCVIECPCQVCKLSRNVCCKSRHSLDCCDSCNPQCRTHSLWVPYMFEPATDQYTMVTDRMTEYRFAWICRYTKQLQAMFCRCAGTSGPSFG